MKIYFLKVDSRYIKKGSKLEKPFNLSFTHTNNEARYWDNLSSVKGINTKLHNAGIKSFIIESNVDESKIFGEWIE